MEKYSDRLEAYTQAIPGPSNYAQRSEETRSYSQELLLKQTIIREQQKEVRLNQQTFSAHEQKIRTLFNNESRKYLTTAQKFLKRLTPSHLPGPDSLHKIREEESADYQRLQTYYEYLNKLIPEAPSKINLENTLKRIYDTQNLLHWRISSDNGNKEELQEVQPRLNVLRETCMKKSKYKEIAQSDLIDINKQVAGLCSYIYSINSLPLHEK